MRERGFEKVGSYAKVDFALPRRQTQQAAGYDFYLPETVALLPGRVVLVPTGVKAYMQSDEVLMLYIRSSLAVKRGLSLVNGVGIIDADYYNNPDNEGHILLALRNNTVEAITLRAGERVAQGIFMKYLCTDEDSSSAKVERTGGIGSTL